MQSVAPEPISSWTKHHGIILSTSGPIMPALLSLTLLFDQLIYEICASLLTISMFTIIKIFFYPHSVPRNV